MLLVNIFWELAKQIEVEDDSVVDIIQVEFDDDAQLQANIWNSIVRKDRDEESVYIVSAKSFKDWVGRSTLGPK